MNRIKITGLLCAALVLIASCKRDTPQTDSPSSTNASAVTIEAKDLVVPANFNFSSEKTLNVRVKVADAKAGERYVIKVYGDVPTTGKLISTGATNANGEYANTIQIPAWEEFIYIEKINPDGSSQFEKVKANQFAAAVFNGSQTNSPYIITKKSSGISCSSCNSTVTNPTGSAYYVVDDNVCITGSNIGGLNLILIDAIVTISGTITGTVNVTVGTNSKLIVCGKGTINTIRLDGNDAAVVFVEGAEISVTNMINTSYYNIINWSDSLKINNSYAPQFINIENHGKMYFMGAVNFDNSTITNNGQLFFMGSGGLVTNASVNTITNNNYLYVENNIGNYPNNIITNNCRLEVKGMIDNEGEIINKGYIKAGIFLQNKHDAAFLELNNGAMMSAGSVYLNTGAIKGTGTGRSKVKAGYSELEKYWTQIPVLEGTLDYCDANGVEINIGIALISSAAFSCDGYIPTSTCNPEGFGAAPPQDTDNDGISDLLDEYPNDATRAFNSFYPNASTTATVAFEDLWPAKADYDFNDLALAFNIQQVLNANNEVVEYKVKMRVKAIGGSYVNGFGFQLDELVPSDIASITGQVLTQNLITRNANNTEAGQSKAVIICYDSPEPTLNRVGGSMFNTVKTNGTGSSDSIRINIVFSTPQVASKLTFTKFNPFIFTNKRRGYEIHMANYRPTDLANTSLFGTFDDRTNPSNNAFYKTTNGMPWAILIPENFVYPIEKTPITGGYNFFDDWAISGGSGYTNWYNNSPGNRNTNNLY